MDMPEPESKLLNKTEIRKNDTPNISTHTIQYETTCQ